jgi:dTMP kinase
MVFPMTLKSETGPLLRNFIVIEGLDGAGTTTQLKLLDRLLLEKHIPHLATCEPTAGPVGELIRRVLRKQASLRPETLAWLFAADRQEHLSGASDGILAALEAGRLVICDRYLFSSLAYQSIETDFLLVRELNERFPLPEILIYLDTPIAVCAERRKARGATELFEEIEFQKRVAEAYERAFALYAGTDLQLVRIDGTLPEEKIRDRIWTLIASLPIVKG